MRIWSQPSIDLWEWRRQADRPMAQPAHYSVFACRQKGSTNSASSSESSACAWKAIVSIPRPHQTIWRLASTQARGARRWGAPRFAEKEGGPFLREEGLHLFEGRLPTPPILWLRLAVSLAVAAQDWRPSGWRRDLLRRVKSIFVFPIHQRWTTWSRPTFDECDTNRGSPSHYFESATTC